MSERKLSAAAVAGGLGRAAVGLTDRQGKVEEEENREPEGQRDVFVC